LKLEVGVFHRAGRECAAELTRFAKQSHTVLILV